MNGVKFAPLSQFSRPVRWGILIILSAMFAVLLIKARLPAALLLGPMMAGIIVEVGQAEIQLNKYAFNLAQGIIGCLVAKALTASIIDSFLQQWPVFLGAALLTIMFNCWLGWGMSKMKLLPGTTAVWGLLPGAASAMMLMAEGYGADARLVAFMQYTRVVLVALIASLIARFWVHSTATPVPDLWFPRIHVVAFLETLVIIMGGVTVGALSRMPAGMLLVPLIAGTVLHVSGLVELELPRWLLASGYVCLGWRIGLRFTRDVLRHAARVLPQILLSIVAVILFCGGLGVLLVFWMRIDPLTAYLATSPGGVDAVAIIAASTHVDVGFIMALQFSRLLLVLSAGPLVSRFFAGLITTQTSSAR